MDEMVAEYRDKEIANGTLSGGYAYTIRYLTMEDLPQVKWLQDKAKNKFLQLLTDEEFTFILNGNGFMIGVFVEEKLIAFRAMLIPELDEEHLGIDIGLKQEDLPKVMYSEVSCVDPAFRGNHLQTMMGELCFERVDTEKFQYICTTVAPHNIPSIKDKLALGMEIVGLKEKYGGKLRYILMKQLSVAGQNSDINEEVEIEMGDIAGQQKLLEEDFSGVAIAQKAGEWMVLYRKKK
ncbi:GNAT family N-acetyltransferase [Lentibacillus daqui]|uniref:GNAT family N-acetyltransferase n=1 Tax=Lentibacillus daqui TaxID=2911514 RepID=UPI0022B1DC0C|nr:GNAT family N-acetyltransferase [Lentibacillus daqui]